MRVRYFTSPFGGLLAAGVHLCHNLGVESSGSQRARISTSIGPDIGFGNRLAHSTASSIDRIRQARHQLKLHWS